MSACSTKQARTFASEWMSFVEKLRREEHFVDKLADRFQIDAVRAALHLANHSEWNLPRPSWAARCARLAKLRPSHLVDPLLREAALT
jgi:hypothetical protein